MNDDRQNCISNETTWVGEFYKHWNETALLKSMDNTLARSNIKAKHVPALLAPGGRLYHDPAGIVLCVD